MLSVSSSQKIGKEKSIYFHQSEATRQWLEKNH